MADDYKCHRVYPRMWLAETIKGVNNTLRAMHMEAHDAKRIKNGSRFSAYSCKKGWVFDEHIKRTAVAKPKTEAAPSKKTKETAKEKPATKAKK